MRNMFFKMKFTIFFFFLFCAFGGMAQGVISLPEYNILYKAYDNIVVFGAGKKTKSLILESEELSISKQTDSTYIVKVSTTSRTAKINIRKKFTKRIVGTLEFRIMNLPSAVIYWGIYPPDSEVSMDQGALHSDYGKDVFWVNSELEISSYEINSPLFEASLRISKGIITPEVISALKKAKTLNNGKQVNFYIVAIVKGKDQILRVARASFVY